jgi:hypothetical protein
MEALADMTVPKLYLTEGEVARMLGHDTAWLRANAPTLEAVHGFPKVDCAIGKRHREAIEEWSRERNIGRRRAPERLNGNNRERHHEL